MNQRSKIGPTHEEKCSWKMNDSEYNNRYQRFGSNERCNAKPAAVRQLDNRDTFRLGNDMFKDSSYMQDYACKEAVPVNRVKHRGGPSSIAPQPGTHMECHSSYMDSFDKKDCLPAKAVRPPPPQGLGWKTQEMPDTRSVNKDKYREYDSHEVSEAKRRPIIISPEYGTIDTNPDTRPKMDFCTTVSNNFVKHSGIFRPDPAPGAVKTPAHGIAGIAGADINAKMDLTTTHQSVFDTKAIVGDRSQAVPPLVKDKSAKTPKWYKSENADEGPRSTQMDDFIRHDGVVRPKSFQPLRQYESPSTKFHTDTLYNQAFTTKDSSKRKPMVPAPRTKDDELIKTVISGSDIYSTEYGKTYTQAPSNFHRPRPIVPSTQNRTGGRFFDSTSYSHNFNCEETRNIARVPSFRPKKLKNPWYKSSSDSDDSHFKSTTQDHYKGERALPASICKPKTKKDQAIGSMDRAVHFETEYNNCFTKETAAV